MLFGRQTLPIPEIARIGHGHVTVQQIRPHLEPCTWDTYFKFGFVRNPFDRYVSTCFFLNRGTSDFANTAQDFMKRALSVPRFRERALVRPQYLQLSGSGGEIALDFVGRFEQLQESYDRICERVGVPTTDLSRRNPSEHAAYTDYYDDELKEIVADFYAEDLRRFDYDFVPSEPTN